MLGRIYTVDLAETAITVAADLCELTAADDKPIAVIGFELYQTTDLGDAQEEVIGVAWIRGNTTSGSGGAAPTPRPVNLSSAAAGFTAETMNTTQASSGTAVTLQHHGWNIRIPTPWTYTPEEYPMTSQATLLCLRMLAAPADSITIGGYVKVLELG